MKPSFVLVFRTKEAQEVYERALFYDSSNPDIYYNVRAEGYDLFCREILFIIVKKRRV